MDIVLVEASRVGLSIMSRIFSERGHRCHCFTDGAEALKYLLDNESVDLVVTSFELPGMSGLELCWQARILSDAGRPLYVIAMSSIHDQERIAEALDSGADDFLVKPPKNTELFARLRAAERMLNAKRDLIRLATIDPLTGIFNRRAFLERAERGLARARGPMAAAIFDIDFFKHVNDTYGHDIGDVVLRSVATEATRISAVLGRLGGEEFGLLFENTPMESAEQQLEKFRATIEGAEIQAGFQVVRITVSAGISSAQPNDTLPAMLKRADLALYAAKTGGRNRIVVDDPIDFVEAVRAADVAA